MIFDKVIALDLETTGFSFSKDKILEIGALAYFPKTGKTEEFERLIKVDEIPNAISLLTGITLLDIKQNGISIIEALKLFQDFLLKDCQRALLVGHNIKAFDLRMLKTKHGPFWATLADQFTVWDTCTSQRELNALNKSKTTPKLSASLASTAEIYGIKRDGLEHRALADARLSFEIFKKQHKINSKSIILSRKIIV